MRGMASDGGFAAASLLEVAVRAAVQAGAPRRTVAATAAAVASVVMAGQRSGDGDRGGASAPPSASQRRRNKRKKKAAKAAKQAAPDALVSPDEVNSPAPTGAVATDDCGAAGQRPGLGEAPDAEPAQAPERLPGGRPPTADDDPVVRSSPLPLGGAESDDSREAESCHTMSAHSQPRTASVATSRTMGRTEPYPARVPGTSSKGGKSRGNRR